MKLIVTSLRTTNIITNLDASKLSNLINGIKLSK